MPCFHRRNDICPQFLLLEGWVLLVHGLSAILLLSCRPARDHPGGCVVGLDRRLARQILLHAMPDQGRERRMWITLPRIPWLNIALCFALYGCDAIASAAGQQSVAAPEKQSAQLRSAMLCCQHGYPSGHDPRAPRSHTRPFQRGRRRDCIPAARSSRSIGRAGGVAPCISRRGTGKGGLTIALIRLLRSLR